MTHALIPPISQIPPLSSGDHLGREEYERRYEAMPDHHAELIEGIVYMASPLRFRSHAVPHSQIMTWLGVYQAATPGIACGDNPTLRLDLYNEPQPDAVLRIEQDYGGASIITANDYIDGSPELLVEIAASSAAIDLREKKQAYLRNRIQEYLVWQVYEQKLDWFQWVTGEYQPLCPEEDGIFRSRVFPGLWLPETALMAGQMSVVLAVLAQGLGSRQHQEFIQALQAAYQTDVSRSSP